MFILVRGRLSWRPLSFQTKYVMLLIANAFVQVAPLLAYCRLP